MIPEHSDVAASHRRSSEAYREFETETYASAYRTLNTNPVFNFAILKLFYITGIRMSLWLVRQYLKLRGRL